MPRAYLKGYLRLSLVTCPIAVDDGVHRQVDGFIVHSYDIPAGCLAAYYPECNPLVPLWHHAKGSQVPAGKGVPVRLMATPAAGA